MNKRWNIIIPVLVFIVLLIPVVIGYKVTKKDYSLQKEKMNTYISECDNSTSELSEKSCNELRNYKVTYREYYNNLSLNSLETTYNVILLIATTFVLITLFVLPLMRNKNLKNKDYKKLVSDILKNAYSVAWVFPLICLIKGIASFVGVLKINSVSVFNLFYPLIDAILAFMFISIIINMALVVARKINNPLIYLLSGMVVYAIFAFAIDRVGNLLMHFGISSGIYLNLLTIDFTNMHYFGAFLNIGLMFVISVAALYLMYKDKTKLIKDCKKNA